MPPSTPPPALPDHLTADATETARRVRAGEVSPVELVADTYRAITAIDPLINAFTVLREDAAMDEAREAERAVAHGDDLGPLHGVPVSVKDVMWLAGVPAADGSPVLRDFVPPTDAVAVRRLREAGAIVVGKTNNPEFCAGGYTDNRLYGLTRNPWDLTRTPGGSSGGAAAAVATGLTPLSLGSDGGGSIREPASFCGVVGMKPTYGLVPRGPGFSGWPTLGAIGPLCRSVRDAALALQVVAGQDPVDYQSLPAPGRLDLTGSLDVVRGLRVGYSLDLGYAAVEPEVKEVFEATVTELSRAGWTLVPIQPDTGDPSALLGVLSSWEGHAPEGAYVDPIVRSWAERDPGAELPPPAPRTGDYIEAMAERQRFAEAYLRVFEDVDVLLTPSVQVGAFATGSHGPDHVGGVDVDPDVYQWCSLSFPANLAGLPAISVPCGVDRRDLPVGLQIMGPTSGDLVVLQAAAAWMELYGTTPWPRLPA